VLLGWRVRHILIMTFLSAIWSACRGDRQRPDDAPHPPAEAPPTSPTADRPAAKPEEDAASPSPQPPRGETEWNRPRTEERRQDRERMVREQIAAQAVRDPAVLQAMRDVPRHWFVPPHLASHAYDDRPLPIGEGQTISQPFIVAFMTEALGLQPDHRVLEIGTGSGYQAAILAELTPHVYTIEIIESLGRQAAEAFRKHGYGTISVKIGDGYQGWAEHAPFDAIIVTCAPDAVPKALIEQLRPGGVMCIPVGDTRSGQELIRVRKMVDGSLERQRLLPVRFVPMLGGKPQGSSDPSP
jgi:protein-L-isoaspartate(D-aspartate) O-methyltransferase